MAKLDRLLQVGTSTLASSLGGWRGTAAFSPAARRPEKDLVLYDFEGCPYCRLVREALTRLDLDALIQPCPKGGKRFRSELLARGGKAQFPYLVDPNNNQELYESADIVDYLESTYGRIGRGPNPLIHGLDATRSTLVSLARPARGVRARPSRAPEQPLELFSFESSPFSRLVRETLCELELPYLLRNTGKALWQDMGPPELRQRMFPDLPVSGRNRERLLERTGRVQVPYLIDPNTGTEMFESAHIIDYLERTYSAQGNGI